MLLDTYTCHWLNIWSGDIGAVGLFVDVDMITITCLYDSSIPLNSTGMLTIPSAIKPSQWKACSTPHAPPS